MNIHEYQAKAMLREFGVPVPRGHAALSVDDAVKAARDLGSPVLVVKAQIHAGGRGKAGGVKVVKSIDDVKREAERLLGSVLVTHQTGPHGKQVKPPLCRGRLGDRSRVLSVGAGRPRDLAGCVRGLDRGRHGHRGGGAQQSGKDHIVFGRSGDRASCRTTAGGCAGARSYRRPRQAGRALVEKLYAAFVAKDMSLLEVNPLVVTKQGQ
jgi:succinyl-CoA synthetase beta subunit